MKTESRPIAAAPTAIIQVRMESTRLPGKVLRPLMGMPMLGHIVERLRSAREIKGIVVATSSDPSNDPIRRFCRLTHLPCFSGSESDVLDRYYEAARLYHADPVVRVTGDCPFTDPELIDALIRRYREGDLDHIGVASGAGAIRFSEPRFPDGLDAECFGFKALERAWRESTAGNDREHVTPYLWREPGRFRTGALHAEHDLSNHRWTVDTEADWKVATLVYQHLYRADRPFRWTDVLGFLESHPEIAETNREWVGKEGYEAVWT